MAGPPHIGAHGFGRIEIDGQPYTSDVIVLPTGVHRNWWRDEGHSLKPGDVADVLEASADVVVIGQGAHECMNVTDETLAYLKQARVVAVCLPTAQAVQAYNERMQRGENVAAALHLTC